MPHPVQLVITDDLRRNRLTVFFRLPLAIPHAILFYAWSIAMPFVLVIVWLIALLLGRVPDGLHRFVASWLRYRAHLQAYMALLANPYPPFSGAEAYSIDLLIAPAARQSRWKTLFRTILVIPAAMVTTAAAAVGTGVAFLGWFAAMFLGRMPEGLRDAGALALRVDAQTQAYMALLTDRLPRFSPTPDEDAPAGAV